MQASPSPFEFSLSFKLSFELSFKYSFKNTRPAQENRGRAWLAV